MENMRLILWTLVGAAAIWFVTMTVNRNIFNHSDIDRSLTGTIPISRTDIGDKCGAQYVNAANEFVQYKVTPTGRLVYLCPQGLWPIQTTVTAVTLSPDFRNSVSPTFRSKLDLFYPPAAAAQSNTNPFNTAPAPTTTQGVPGVPNAPVYAAPAAPAQAAPQNPVFQGAPQPRGAKTTAPAAPAQNVNPFIGAPATH